MDCKLITSEGNALIKEARKIIRSSRHGREIGKTVAEGIHLARELVKFPHLIDTVVLRAGAEANPEIAELLPKFEAAGAKMVATPAPLFQSMSPVETSAGILCLIKIPESRGVEAGKSAVYLDGVQDPGNVGAIVRSAVASGVTECYTSLDAAWVWSPKAVRAGMGSHFYMNFAERQPVSGLKEASGCSLLVADARGGSDLYETEWSPEKTVWVFGSEGLGVSDASLKAADRILLIPLNPAVESLNVAVAAALCLFEQKRRTRL